METGDGESIDDMVGILENEVERAIKCSDLPPALDHEYYLATITSIDRTNNVPTLTREKGAGTILFPVILKFTLLWK